MEIKIKDVILGSLGLIPVLAGVLLLKEIYSNLFYFLVIISIFLILTPLILRLAIQSNRQKKMDAKFLEFTRDLVENVKAATPISKSIINLRTRDYGVLSGHIKKLANQISLGIPLSKSLETFAKDSKSPVIIRSVSLISEAEKSGGRIDSIIESVSNSVNQTENLKKERRSSIFNLTVQGYIIFIIFLIIMLVLQFKILPMVSGFSAFDSQIKTNPQTISQFSKPLLILILIQSFFAGIVIGKLSEGSLKDGLKHSFILVFLSLLLKYGAEILFG